MTEIKEPWFAHDDDHEHSCAIFYFADAECDCHEPQKYSEGPPYDAATATGMYDAW